MKRLFYGYAMRLAMRNSKIYNRAENFKFLYFCDSYREQLLNAI